MRKMQWTLCLLLTLVMLVADAEAGRRRHGSSGSSGSSGYGGGSSGSSGSSGSYAGGGSSGSYGSSGSSGGSYSSYGSAGSSGGAGYPLAATSTSGSPTIAKAVAPTTNNSALLALTLPVDAQVYLVDQKMSVEGGVRQFMVPNLENGKTYDYPIRIELTRGGQTYSISANQQLSAGGNVQLVCTFAGNSLNLAQMNGQSQVSGLKVAQQSVNQFHR